MDSNDATVIEYKAADGTTKAIAVADAAYRHVKPFGVYQVDTPELTNFTSANISSNWYIDGVKTKVPDQSPMRDSVTNDAIYEQWSSIFRTDKSAKENCDIWMKYNNQTDSQGIVGVPAVAWCRSQKIAGRSCNLPNIYETMVIWACGDQIDLIDPTASTNSDLRLGYTATGMSDFYGRCQARDGNMTNYLYSSTEYSGDYMRSVQWSGYQLVLSKVVEL